MIRWGILGTGYAATEFARGLRRIREAEITAVASRSAQRAEQFANQCAARMGYTRPRRYTRPKGYTSYQQLIEQSSADVIYVGTDTALHVPLCLAAIECGKPVLCEKPFALDAREAEEVVSAARARGVFCMEAMWTRFIPLMASVRRYVSAGCIGEVQTVSADFGLRRTETSHPRLFRPDSGGALLDLGVYPVSLAVDFLGMPDEVSWQCVTGDYGQGPVTERAIGTLRYGGGRLASVTADIRCQTPTVATLVGTEGYLQIQTPMYRPERAALVKVANPERSESQGSLARTLSRSSRIMSAVHRRLRPNGQIIRERCLGNGYHYQAIEVMKCVREERTESPVMPLDQTLNVLRVIDAASACQGQSEPSNAPSPSSVACFS